LGRFFQKLGLCSYEIFLLQMFVFGFVPINLMSIVIPNYFVMNAVRIILTTCLSIVPVLVYKKMFSDREISGKFISKSK
jgi:membrane protein implicated in regulation of membrane protease activity